MGWDVIWIGWGERVKEPTSKGRRGERRGQREETGSLYFFSADLCP